MKNSITPNLVQSLDAAMLHLTVHRALTLTDIRSFTMVHDSYGTHAGRPRGLPRLVQSQRRIGVPNHLFALVKPERRFVGGRW